VQKEDKEKQLYFLLGNLLISTFNKDEESEKSYSIFSSYDIYIF